MQKNITNKKEAIFDRIPKTLEIKTERLTITEIKNEDKKIYASLYLDDQLNKWWGYDYREDLGEKEANPDYFYDFQNLLKEKKEEFSFAVRKDNEMIGELVLHNFDDEGGVEMGFRFFKSVQGKGYAIESASALKSFVFDTLFAEKLKSRCFKENLPSAKLIGRLGLTKCDESDTHYFFSLEKSKR